MLQYISYSPLIFISLRCSLCRIFTVHHLLCRVNNISHALLHKRPMNNLETEHTKLRISTAKSLRNTITTRSGRTSGPDTVQMTYILIPNVKSVREHIRLHARRQWHTQKFLSPQISVEQKLITNHYVT